MSEDISQGSQTAVTLTTHDEVVRLAREAIRSSRIGNQKESDATSSVGTPQPGITVDLGHRNLVHLSEEVIDVIKNDIERLAISHNRVASFPARLAECNRLRYLNVRHNSLKDIPKPVLQLSSLEILDVSRNRLRAIPDDIKNLTCLKVLAVQRNKIEKLPLCLGDMNSLRLLKLDENPISFPPQEVYAVDTYKPFTTSSNEREAHITTKVKKFLRQHSSAAINRLRLQVESEVELIDEAAETPRPPRAAGARFPVKPSISSIEALGLPSTPPPNEPPPIPQRSHQRVRSAQSSIQKALSLPFPSNSASTVTEITLGPEGEHDLMVRPKKRHGIITPRGVDPSGPSSETSPLLSDRSHFDSRADVVRQLSPTSRDLINAFHILSGATNHMIAELRSEMGSTTWQNRLTLLKAKLEFQLRAASEALDRQSQSLSHGCADLPQFSNVNFRIVVNSALETLVHVWKLAQLLDLSAAELAKHLPSNHYRSLFWELNRCIWDILAACLHVCRYWESSTATTTAGFTFEGQGFDASKLKSTGPVEKVDSIAPQFSRSTSFVLRLKSQAYDTVSSPGEHSPIPRELSPPSMSQNSTSFEPEDIQAHEDHLRQEIANDLTWDNLYLSLRALCDRGNECLPKIQAHYATQKTLRPYDSENDVHRILNMLTSRSSLVTDASNSLSKILQGIKLNDRAVRHSPNFWHTCTNLFVEWFRFVETTRSVAPPQLHADIKPIMKSVHVAVKDALARVASSPWAHYTNGIPVLAPSGGIDNFQGSSAGSVQQHSVFGSVPSTPLSAALGPAARATVPSKSHSRINFFERADKFVATQQLGGPAQAGIYNRKQ